jgi:integrase
LQTDNPFEGVKPVDPGADREKRLPFSVDDLRAIFSSPLYTGSESVAHRSTPGKAVIRDAKFWLPLLALYTGARLDELGQLLVADVKSEDGVTYLDLNTIGEGKHIKNKGSRRKVPVHPELVRAGFLRYVDRLRRKHETQVFPELKPDARGVWTGALSTWLNRYLDTIGIKDRRKVIHSFRHTFKDALPQGAHPGERSRCPHRAHERKRGTQLRQRRAVGRLAEAVAKISYQLDLTRLHG